MRVILKLVKRNTLNYLYDKTSVFFSLLSVLIIVFLYVAFIGDLHVQAFVNKVEDMSGVRWLIDSWMLAGLITVNSITIPLTILSNMINDMENKTINDFLTAPISRRQIIFGYLASSWVIGIVITLFTLIVGEIYVLINGGELISFLLLGKTLLMIILSVVSFSSISFFILTFAKSNSSVGVINSLVGTLIGFLAGIYIPLGTFGEKTQIVIKLNPAAHVASIFRQIFMEKPLGQVFSGADQALMQKYRYTNGIDINLFGNDLSIPMMVLYLLLISIIFFALSVIRLNKMKR